MRKRVLIAPVLVTAAVVLLLFLFRELPRIRPQLDFFERLERLTYDWRVQQAQPATNLVVPDYVGAVFIDEATLNTFNMPTNGGYQYPLPRFLYGQAIKELKDQGARAVAIDVFFLDRNYERDKVTIPVSGQETLSSDDYFARQLKEAGNVLLAASPKDRVGSTIFLQPPIDLFQTNAAQIGFTTIKIDSDGVRRRCRAFIDDPALIRRFWNLGILLAARRLNLDLENITLQPGWLILRGPGTTERRIPLDADGCFYIHWTMPLHSLPSENQYNLVGVCEDAELRSRGFTHPTQFRDKLVVIAAAAHGSNLSDWGATPLEAETVLGSSIWNIAASVVENKFVRRSSSAVEMVLILFMAALSAALSWRLRALWASCAILSAAALYVVIALWLYMRYRYWLPVVLPVAGAMLMTYACLVAYRLLIEAVEQSRISYIRAAFGQRFSKDILDMLLKEEKAPQVVQFLGLPANVIRALVSKDYASEKAGVRRRVSIFFADIRNFTEFIDTAQAQAEQHVRESKLSHVESERYLDEAVRDLLGTVNLYLSTIAEMVRAHQGTLDKYVGDAVMAFWGAPLPDEQHAVACVRAAVAAQRAIRLLNEARQNDNAKRTAHNAKAGSATHMPMLPVLNVGIAVNSGAAIVGFMGSANLISNYTVFGKEVNIASRLERLAGSGRIVLSSSTYEDLQKYDPALANACLALEPVTLRGIRSPIGIYELPLPAAH